LKKFDAPNQQHHLYRQPQQTREQANHRERLVNLGPIRALWRLQQGNCASSYCGCGGVASLQDFFIFWI
jgi:hypothetical protein